MRRAGVAAVVTREAEQAAAFDAWARLCGPRLLRFAMVVCGNPHDAGDRVQDALAAVYPRWVRLSGEGAAEAYARTVVLHRSISWWRRIGRREQAQADPAGAATSTHRAPTALDTRVTDAALAHRLLMTLSPVQRAAVALRFYLDCDYAEIGETLGCPQSTARSHVRRALGRLRERMAEVDDHD